MPENQEQPQKMLEPLSAAYIGRMEVEMSQIREEIKILRQSRHEQNNHANAVGLQLNVIEGSLKQQDRVLSKIDEAVSGTSSTPGLVIRIDRLEMAVGGFKKIVWLMVTAFIMAFVGSLVAILTRKT